MSTTTPTPEAILAAKAEHGSLRAAAKALGRSESTLRGILKRAEAQAQETAQAAVEEVHEAPAPATIERPLNRAERRAAAKRHPRTHFARRVTRPFRSAFSDWTGTIRTTQGISPFAVTA